MVGMGSRGPATTQAADRVGMVGAASAVSVSSPSCRKFLARVADAADVSDEAHCGAGGTRHRIGRRWTGGEAAARKSGRWRQFARSMRGETGRTKSGSAAATSVRLRCSATVERWRACTRVAIREPGFFSSSATTNRWDGASASMLHLRNHRHFGNLQSRFHPRLYGRTRRHGADGDAH